MATGACGIDCTVCRLHVQGVCSTCGAGNSEAGRKKLEGQKHLFGQGCGLLQCAVDRELAYCMRDCDEFPCELYENASIGDGVYPFSGGFLDMQRRRRAEAGSDSQAAWPKRAAGLWDQLTAADLLGVCARSRAKLAVDHQGEQPSPRLDLQSLEEAWQVDIEGRSIRKVQGDFGGEWDRQMPFLMLVYLTHVSATPEAGEMVAPREVYAGLDAFAGRHALHTQELESTFGRNRADFVQAGACLGAEPICGGDVAFRLRPLPKLPVDYLLWLADDEFPARVTVLLGRDTSLHYPADACAVVVNLLIRRLLLVGRSF